MNMLVGLAGLAATAHGITVSTSNPLYHVSGEYLNASFSLDSKPGTPKFVAWEGAPLLSTIEPWRVELGNRLLKAARAHDAMMKCGRFLSFGDYTWCMKAMPREAAATFKESYRNVHEFVVNQNVEAPRLDPEALSGLSFGIRTSDAWSELMSSMFLVKTELFDCYYNGTHGPMVDNMHDGYSLVNPCQQRGCYTAAYEAHRVCNDDTTASAGTFQAANGMSYEPLHHTLAGRPKLSTFIKMDVEGSEWATLERLLDDEEDMAKIRAFDMEVHLNLEATPGRRLKITPEILTRHVELMEKLARKFAVTGSSLETLAQSVFARPEKARAHFRKYDPPFVYTKDGLALDQYTISFVNRELL